MKTARSANIHVRRHRGPTEERKFFAYLCKALPYRKNFIGISRNGCAKKRWRSHLRLQKGYVVLYFTSTLYALPPTLTMWRPAEALKVVALRATKRLSSIPLAENT